MKPIQNQSVLPVVYFVMDIGLAALSFDEAPDTTNHCHGENDQDIDT